MSITTDALEDAVRIIMANRPKEGEEATRRQRAAIDRAFARILTLIAPRIRHFTRQYGLVAHAEDAEQCCAIGVHRAIQDYDPTKARFTTFVNWQLRGELQALRYRLMTDQRGFAKKVSARTVSLDQLVDAAAGEEAGAALQIVDEDALDLTESGVADLMAERTADTLVDLYVAHLRRIGQEQIHRQARRKGKRAGRTSTSTGAAAAAVMADMEEMDRLEERLERDRMIIRSHLLEDETSGLETLCEGISRDRVRQIGRRGAVAIAQMLEDGAPEDLPFLRRRLEMRVERDRRMAGRDMPPVATLAAVMRRKPCP